MKSLLLFSVAIAAALPAAAAAPGLRAGVEILSTSGRNVYRLAIARTGGAPAEVLIVGSTYDNRVCAFTTEGKNRWDVPVGGFVFDLAAGDLDGDGRDEIAAAGADGSVYVFGSEGKLRWKRDLGAPVYQVAIARLDGKTPVVLAGGVTRQVVAFAADGTKVHSVDTKEMVRVLRAGDFDGDGADEVAVLSRREVVSFYRGQTLTALKETIAGKTSLLGGLGWTLRQANGTVADLDGDGAAEFIYLPGAFTLKGGLRKRFDLPGKFREASYDTHYRMRMVAAGDLTDRPGAETVVLEGAQVTLYDNAGRELGQAAAPFGFTDVVYLPGQPHGSVILGSSPNGDDNLYRLTFTPGWEKALEKLPRRGAMAGIGGDLEKIATAAARWTGEPMRGADGPYDVVLTHANMWRAWNPRSFDSWIASVRAERQQFPYSRLRFSAHFWPSEKAPLLRPDGSPWSRDPRMGHLLTREQLVEGAKRFEAAGCHFWVSVGHGCGPYMELATLEAMLAAAPTTLLGFTSAEDEKPEAMHYYFQHYVRPLLELCLTHQKRFILKNKNVWWAYWPAEAKMHELIFNGRYRSVLLPCVEDSNTRSSDVNLAARVGLWLDGQVDAWASRSIADQFSFNRAWEWEYVMTGHPVLRYNVAQAMLGARVFMLLNGEQERVSGRWTRVGAEGSAPFLHLLGRGAITPPQREQLRAVSPVALVMRQPSQRFVTHGANGHGDSGWARDASEGQAWAFDRLDCYWGMAPLPPTDVATYLWGRTRRDPAQIPTTTPHGLVALVPGGAAAPGDRWSTAWTTDGDSLRKAGRAYSLPEARQAMGEDLAAAEKDLPFHVEGRVFHQVVEHAPNLYIIALVDSGWLDPAERTVHLTTRLPGTWSATDRLTGAPLGPLATPLELRVSAGTIRLLEVRRN